MWMLAPAWFHQELKNLDKNYFAVFNPFEERWQIRMWKPDYEERFDLSFIEILRRSVLVKTVCYERNGKDIGYMPLDRRVLTKLRQERWNYEHQDEVIKEIDEHNQRLLDKAQQWLEDVCRKAVETGYNAWKRLFLDLGKK